MKLATFQGSTGQHVGFVDNGAIVDLTAADPSLANMIELLGRGPREVRQPFRRLRAYQCQV